MTVETENLYKSAEHELDELLRRAKRLSQRISDRVRELLGDDTDEWLALPDDESGDGKAAAWE